MRITILVLLCAVALGGGRRHGRRLFQNIERRPRSVRNNTTAVTAPSKEPAPDAELPLTANRTIGLLRERELLQDRVAAIDRALAADRDQKRRDLTAQYEREMRELEEGDWGLDAPARASPSPELNAGALRQQVSAALASYRQQPQGSELPHQDVEHQDIDIDMMIMHIDKDQDGVITPAEAYGRQQAGAQGMQGMQTHTQLVGGNAWKLIGPAIIGCACAIACYLSLRQLIALRMRPSRRSGPHDHFGLPSDASRKRRKNVSCSSSSIPPTCYNRPERDPVR